MRKIRELIKIKPDATLAEVAEALNKPAHPATVSRTLARLNLPRTKSLRVRPSRIARDVKLARDRWLEQFADVRVDQGTDVIGNRLCGSP